MGRRWQRVKDAVGVGHEERIDHHGLPALVAPPILDCGHPSTGSSAKERDGTERCLACHEKRHKRV